jgi:M6 family metalloprotease-like protein
MRRFAALVLASLTLSTTFVSLLAAAPQVSPIGSATAALGDYGPHLMMPRPGQSAALPRQPDGWTGTPPPTRSSHGTRALGIQDVLVILVEFNPPGTVDDTLSTVPSSSLNTLMNDATPGAPSARNFYDEVSYGLFGVSGTVTNWFQSTRSMAYYGEDSASGYDDRNGAIYELVIDAVQLADATVDFSSFDNDPRDGVVDHVIVVHAGDAQEERTANTDLIWSHRWSVADADPVAPGTQRLVVDGVQVYGYIMTSETSPVGVFVHELGHDLGLPDLYDTDGSSDGVGEWDVMGAGSWNGNPSGSSPAHFSAPSKIELGWIAAAEVDQALLNQTINQAETFPEAYKLVVRSGTNEEAFVVENRRRIGFDSGLPGEGLLIWHVDLSIAGNSDDAHRRVDLEEADGDDQPTEAADAWAANADGFGPETNPSSQSYLNQQTGWKVRNISPAGPAMTADLSREIVDDLVVVRIDRDCCVAVAGSVDVTATVGNRGARTQTGFAVTLNAYRGSDDPSLIFCCVSRTVATLAQGETVPLNWSVPATTAGKYILEVGVLLAADEIPENNVLFAHFSAATYYWFDPVESGDRGWSRNGSPGSDPAMWEIVQDTANESHSHSPSHAWRFHTTPSVPLPCPPSCPPTFHTLTSPTINVPGGPTYFYFWHRYDLRGRGIDNLTGTQETDSAYLNVSVNGVWHQPPTSVVPFVDFESEWRVYQWDLSPFTTTASTVVLEFRVSDSVLQDEGGWWLDDIAVADTPLVGGVVARAVTPQVVVEPGALAVFRIKVANVGDFEDNVGFALAPPSGWSAGIGPNLTNLQDYDAAEVRLGPDAEANLLLVFSVSANETRGSRFPIAVTAVSRTNASLASTFDTLTIINDPLGLSGLTRYLYLFIVVFAVVVIIAVVIDALKKQKGVYRRW